jgi:DNA-binding response OmpR family regulator
VRLLVAESCEPFGDALARGLRGSGYIADLARDGETALAYARCRDYAAAVISWQLPALPVVRRLRLRDTRLPVLLTGKATTAGRVAGLDAGADDFLAAPFDPAELAARLRALQRRAQGTRSPSLTAGGITFDLAAREARAGGTALPLTVTELGILEVLMRRSPAAVPRWVIALHVWADDATVLGSNTISVHVMRIRAKMPATVRIETVHGTGYRLRGGTTG